jgi:hypothetical protein
MNKDSGMHRNDDEVFPIVAAADGGLSDDGLSVLIKLSTVEHQLVHLAVRLADLAGFVTFVLHLAAHRGSMSGTSERSDCQPISVSEVCVREFENGRACLCVRVGSTELIFAIPAGGLSNLAQELLHRGALFGHRGAV